MPLLTLTLAQHPAHTHVVATDLGLALAAC